MQSITTIVNIRWWHMCMHALTHKFTHFIPQYFWQFFFVCLFVCYHTRNMVTTMFFFHCIFAFLFSSLSFQVFSGIFHGNTIPYFSVCIRIACVCPCRWVCNLIASICTLSAAFGFYFGVEMQLTISPWHLAVFCLLIP